MSGIRARDKHDSHTGEIRDDRKTTLIASIMNINRPIWLMNNQDLRTDL